MMSVRKYSAIIGRARDGWRMGNSICQLIEHENDEPFGGY